MDALEALMKISKSYEGKQLYFKNWDGLIYSKVSFSHLTIEQAVQEFCELIERDEAERQHSLALRNNLL